MSLKNPLDRLAPYKGSWFDGPIYPVADEPTYPDDCRVPKCPTALNVRRILFFSKSVIMVTLIIINSKISKYFKKNN